MALKTFPTLFKKSETDAIVRWHIAVESYSPDKAVIVTSWGQEGGAVQATSDVITEGKNLGKKNETSAFEQACAEAQSKWEKQQKNKKYVADRDAALAGKRSDLVKGGIDPMLAFPIEKKPKALKFPCAIQRKYDGHRVIAHVRDGVCNLWSRSRKPIPSVPHIQRALEARFPTGEYWFDGEGYTMAVSFEKLTSFLRSDEPQPGHEVVEYHIYDVVLGNFPYIERLRWLTDTLCAEDHPLVLAPTVIVRNETEMNALFEKFLDAGYEGAMARNLDGLYVGKRSPDLLKLKKFQDAEFECVGVETDVRTVTDSAGTREVTYPVFVCKLPDGSTFNTPMMGELDHVRKLAPSIPGKRLTVKFQDYTKDGKPRFPKARLYVAL